MIDFINRHAGKILAACAIIVAILVVAGCGQEVRPPGPTPAPDPVDVLGSIGASLTWFGGICAAAGLALSLIALFYPPIAWLSVVFRLAGVGGAGVTGVGITYLFFAQHSWLLLALGAVACGAVVWWYWPKLHRLVDRRMDAAERA